MTSVASRQYACTKCFNWFEFEQLSKESQLCQECSKTSSNSGKSVNGGSLVKKKNDSLFNRDKFRCKFCRTEFRNTGKTKSYLCERCIKNKTEHGEPRNCSLCNLSAAFIGSKCRRCASSLKKYGPVQSCHQCKLKAAFNHPKAWVEGQLLCWLCTSTTQHAIRKVKRRATEEGKPHKHKKPKMTSSQIESSPTEFVIEEEVVIQEKDSESEQQSMWEEFPPQDMDYRLPPSSFSKSSVPEKQVFQMESSSSESPSVARVRSEDRKRRSMSPLVDRNDFKHKIKSSPKSGTETSDAGKKTSHSRIDNDKRHRHRHKDSRRSAPVSSSSKHNPSKPGLNDLKLSSLGFATKSLDAKIFNLQKKLSHKTGDKSSSREESAPHKSQHKSSMQNKNMDDVLAKDTTNTTQPSSLSSFKVSDSGGPMIFERFRTTDSGSSSPLPVVNDGNIVVVTQLRAEISGLKKQMTKKDQEMIEKDKQISCIKVEHLRDQRDLRAKMKDLVTKHSETLEQLKKKNQDLLKKISQLSKGRA